MRPGSLGAWAPRLRVRPRWVLRALSEQQLNIYASYRDFKRSYGVPGKWNVHGTHLPLAHGNSLHSYSCWERLLFAPWASGPG